MQFHVMAVGAAKSGAEHDLAQHYIKQIKPTPKLHRISDAPSNMAASARLVREAEAIDKKMPAGAVLCALDATGKQLTSEAFATHIQRARDNGNRDMVFVIGGQDGLCRELVKRAEIVVAFGAMIWPHKLAYVMLCEQLFRAQCIAQNHPYHRGHE